MTGPDRVTAEVERSKSFVTSSSSTTSTLPKRGTLLHADEAIRFIEQIPDPVTRSLVNMAFVRFVKAIHVDRQDAPWSDVDSIFLVKVLHDFFGEHEILERTLAGETVGAWFDDMEQAPPADEAAASDR